MSPRACAAALLMSLLPLFGPLHAGEPASLVPATPSTVPDYFCTWNTQGFACSYTNANDQADQMIEQNLFGPGPHRNWLAFYPAIRADLTFLLDDAFDFPLGGGHNHPSRGSIELDPQRFPSFTGTPAERLSKLSAAVKARGWRDLGLWICNSRPNMDELPIDSETYWTERLAWSQQAGIGNWKVDWGIGVKDKPLWKFKLTPRGRAAAPGVWMESGTTSDIFRTYDVGVTVSIPETLRRIAQFLEKTDPNDRRLINCEDEVYIGAGAGCCYGIMRHPLPDPMPNGKPDGFFVPHFRNLKKRIDEVTRAVRWHRIAQPFPKGGPFLIDTVQLHDFKSRPAPARLTRGGLPLPDVRVAEGASPPYVVASRHPCGALAVATVARNLERNGRPGVFVPQADVTLDAGPLTRPVGIFGEYASLTLLTPAPLAGRRILAQDLAGETPVDITADVTLAEGQLTLPGAVLKRVGLMAATPGDLSEPALVLAIEGLTTFPPLPAMKPGMFNAPSALPAAPQVTAGQSTPDKPAAPAAPAAALNTGTPARLQLSTERATLPDDGTETRVTFAVLDASGKPLANEVSGTLAITTGKGLFPTGQTYDFRTRGGQDSIEFRSYDAGTVTLTARSPGLPPATLTLTVTPAKP